MIFAWCILFVSAYMTSFMWSFDVQLKSREFHSNFHDCFPKNLTTESENLFKTEIGWIIKILPDRPQSTNWSFIIEIFSIEISKYQNKPKGLKVSKWRRDEWRMMKVDEGWMKDDEGCMKKDEGWWFQAVEGFCWRTD